MDQMGWELSATRSFSAGEEGGGGAGECGDEEDCEESGVEGEGGSNGVGILFGLTGAIKLIPHHLPKTIQRYDPWLQKRNDRRPVFILKNINPRQRLLYNAYGLFVLIRDLSPPGPVLLPQLLFKNAFELGKSIEI